MTTAKVTKWRDGKPCAERPAQEGDLEWLSDNYCDPQSKGKWFRFDARDSIWRCLDPFNQKGINETPHQPPSLDRHGRLPGEAGE